MAWVALVGPEEEENLGLRYLASSLASAGFRAEILPFNAAGDLARVANAILSAQEPPLLVGISLAFQWRAKDCLALAVALKEGGYTGHITAGGHFGAFSFREVLRDFPELDSICRHEAEETIVALAQAVAAGESLDAIAGLAFRNSAGEVALTPLPRQPDLAALPWPDRRGRPVICLGHAVAPLVASRGCYADCAFCCIAAWHKSTASGVRFRTRPLEDVADEMADLNRRLGIDIFIFHDDNFFVPGHAKNIERINALADALEARGIGRIGIVVKARPTDVTPEVFRAARDRLGCIRVFLGIENDSPQGLQTLRRRVRQDQNHEAMRILADLGIYVCFNMLIFDPDATIESLQTNLAFMETHAEEPWNFGRVELYAGTPLLARMQAEGRCEGDYLGWNYRLASPDVQRVFEIMSQCFFSRNFAPGAMANRLQGTRFDVEVCRYFHPDIFRTAWLAEAKGLSRRLAGDSVAGLREIIEFVQAQPDGSRRAFVEDLSRRLRRTEAQVREAAEGLEQRIQDAVGRRCRHGRPVEFAIAVEAEAKVADT